MKIFIKIKDTLPYIPILFFILIAGHHFYLVKYHHLSPWQGGGYGMFSTTDYGPSRFIKVFALKDNIIQEEIEIPDQLSMLSKRVRSLPDDKNMQNLAIALESYLAFNQHIFPTIRLEIWATRYNSETLQPSYHKLNAIDYKTTH